MSRIRNYGSWIRLSSEFLAPMLTITAPSLVGNETYTAFDIVITANKPVYGLTLGDIGVDNGSASAFTGSDGDTVYGATITPTSAGAVTISIAANVCSQLPAGGGLGNLAADDLVVTYYAYFLHDEFTDTNGTLLNAHTISPHNVPATSWTLRNGNWNIQSNLANVVGSAPSPPLWIATVNLGIADYSVESIVRFTGAGGTQVGGVVVRYGTGDGKFYVATISRTSTTFAIYHWDGATLNSVASTTITAPVLNTNYTLVVTCSGSTISATFDGGNLISYGSATVNQTSTHAGLRGNSSDPSTVFTRFDDYKAAY